MHKSAGTSFEIQLSTESICSPKKVFFQKEKKNDLKEIRLKFLGNIEKILFFKNGLYAFMDVSLNSRGK